MVFLPKQSQTISNTNTNVVRNHPTTKHRHRLEAHLLKDSGAKPISGHGNSKKKRGKNHPTSTARGASTCQNQTSPTPKFGFAALQVKVGISQTPGSNFVNITELEARFLPEPTMFVDKTANPNLNNQAE